MCIVDGIKKTFRPHAPLQLRHLAVDVSETQN